MISDNSWRTHYGVVNIMKSALLMGSISEQARPPLNGLLNIDEEVIRETSVAAGQFGWSQEVKASGPRPGLIHYPAPAATRSQPPPKQPFTGSFLLRDSPPRRPVLDTWLDHHTSSPSCETSQLPERLTWGYEQHLLQYCLQGNRRFPRIVFQKKEILTLGLSFRIRFSQTNGYRRSLQKPFTKTTCLLNSFNPYVHVV